jgi:FMN phosphatase YigB (HAD superfamily)
MKEDSRAPRILCFDLGGVIIRTCGSWAEVCARAGLPYHAEVDRPDVQARIRELDDVHQIGRISDDLFLENLARATNYDRGEIEGLHDAWLRGEYSGMDDLIHALNRNGRFATACLSNTNRRHWELMEGIRSPLAGNGSSYPAFRALSHREASHHYGLVKPSPEVYRRFAAEIGASPEEILFFDDREENVAAARKEGWRAEQVDAAGDTALQIREILTRMEIL